MKRRKNLKLTASAFVLIGAVTLLFHTAAKAAAAASLSGKEEVRVAYPVSAESGTAPEEESRKAKSSYHVEMDSLNKGTPEKTDLTMEEAAEAGISYLEEIFERDFTDANVFMMYDSGTETFPRAFWVGDVLFEREQKPESTRWTFFLDAVTGELFIASFGRMLDVTVPLEPEYALENDYGIYEKLAREFAERFHLVEGEISSVSYNCQGYSGNDPTISLNVEGKNGETALVNFSRYDQKLLGVGTDAERRIREDALESLEAEETFFWPAEGENTPEHF